MVGRGIQKNGGLFLNTDKLSQISEKFIRSQVEVRLKAEQDQLKAQYARQTALAEVELVISHQYELEATLNRIATITTDLLPATGGASLILWNAEDESYYTCASTVPGQTPQLATQRVRKTGGATRWIIDHCQPLIMPDIKDDPFTANTMLTDFALQAYVGLPLLNDGQPLGVLYALDIQPREYAAADLEFLTALANRAALVINQVSLYEALQVANRRLRQEGQEKTRLIAELQSALAEINTLQGLIPICCNCKNIRDDQGFWQQVETYIEKHSAAKFSHGICNDCMKTLYPEFCKDNDQD